MGKTKELFTKLREEEFLKEHDKKVMWKALKE